MEEITIGFIILLNIVAMGALYQAIGNKVSILNRIVMTAFGVLLMYILLFIVYSISSLKQDKIIVNAARQIILFTILPINIMCIMRPIIIQIRKLRDKEIKQNKFNKKILIYGIIAIVILIIEFSYIRDIQNGIYAFKFNSQ